MLKMASISSGDISFDFSTHQQPKIIIKEREMSKSCDLKFIRIVHILVHLGLIVVFVRLLFNFFDQYEEHDEDVRQLVYVMRDKCTNVTIIIDYILDKKNEIGQQIVLHMIYLMSILVSLILMLVNHVATLSAYTLFFMTILTGNLVVHFMRPFLTIGLFITSTTLSAVYVLVYLLPDFYERTNKQQRKQPRQEAIPLRRASSQESFDDRHQSILVSAPMLRDSQLSLVESRL